MQPAGGVYDQYVSAPGLGGLVRVESNRTWVAAGFVSDYIYTYLIAKNFQLLGGGGTEGGLMYLLMYLEIKS